MKKTSILADHVISVHNYFVIFIYNFVFGLIDNWKSSFIGYSLDQD